jgi:hypothetical protein
MKKYVFLAIAMLVSGSVCAATDHYFLRNGNHVHHLKITKSNDEYIVSSDVDFEPNANEEAGSPFCSADISGEGKMVSENEMVMKKHSESEASYCELKIHLSATGAKIEQSKDCDNFVVGICHFASDGKELLKLK